jgi:hypothetical protein
VGEAKEVERSPCCRRVTPVRASEPEVHEAGLGRMELEPIPAKPLSQLQARFLGYLEEGNTANIQHFSPDSSVSPELARTGSERWPRRTTPSYKF